MFEHVVTEDKQMEKGRMQMDDLSDIAKEVLKELESNELENSDALIQKINEFCNIVANGDFSNVATAELGRSLLHLCMLQQIEILKLKQTLATMR